MTFPVAPIGALTDVALGKMLQPSKRSENDELRPYLRAAHVQPHGAVDWQVEQKEMWFSCAERATLSLQRDDVVVVEGGAGFGRAAHMGEDIEGWGFQNSIVRVRAGSQSKGRFIAYALRSALASGAIEVATSTATIPHFTAEKVGRFRIPAPPPEEQRRIADYLDRETAEIDGMDAELDRLIETMRERQRSKLLALGHRLSAPGERTRIGYLLTKKAREVRTGDGVVTAFRDGQVTLRSNRREDGFTMSFSETGYQGVEPGDFVFHGLDGFAGAVGVSDERGKASPVYHVCTAKAHTSEVFMAWALRGMAVSGLLEAYAWSVRQRSVDYRNWAVFAGLPMTYIELDEQRRIVAELDEQTARIDDMIADADRLKALLAERRSTLITEVVTGVKEVPA